MRLWIQISTLTILMLHTVFSNSNEQDSTTVPSSLTDADVFVDSVPDKFKRHFIIAEEGREVLFQPRESNCKKALRWFENTYRGNVAMISRLITCNMASCPASSSDNRLCGRNLLGRTRYFWNKCHQCAAGCKDILDGGTRYISRNEDDCRRAQQECNALGCANNSTCVHCETGYRCLCPAGFQGINCDVVTPSVEPPELDLIVTIEKSHTTPRLGDRVRFSCSVNDEAATLTWYKDGNRLANGILDDLHVSNSEVLILDFSYIHQGQYDCSAVGRDGAFAESVFAFWLPFRLLFATYPVNVTVAQNANHTLPCSAINRLHIIRWEKDGAPVVKNEHVFKLGDDLVIADATLMEEGLYTCVLYEGLHRIRAVTAYVDIDAHQEITEVCGTITAEEVISIEDSAGAGGRVSIVGGRKAIYGSAPWTARLYDRNTREHFCGGSIVNNLWVITAAHCITETGISTSSLMVRLGDYDTRLTDDSEIPLGVDEIIISEGFDESTFDKDIALIKLSTPVYLFTDYIRPICLPNVTLARRLYKVGNQGKVTGWGRGTGAGPLPRYLAEERFPLVGKKGCKASTDYPVTLNMFCAGHSQGSACTGNSGSPFALEYRGRWYLFGIVSWGEGCAQVGKYGFYTKVSKMLDWVNGYIYS
ncbi:Coagulation factor X [Holothuria leucospilota]|uniref:Coagulation factor X n=1 Tax=Holothuria leucospilota TaxID=206669 RepID=A0A9Q1HH33_HOLLE|nr:Coagulation factor X [Holothuria leucospilota]